MKKGCYLAIMTAMFLSINLCSGVEVNPANCVIEIPKNANSSVLFAASELQKHLQLIGNRPVPVKKYDSANPSTKGTFTFYVGIPAPDDKTPLAKEEARRVITSAAAWSYGEDWMLKDNPKKPQAVVCEKLSRTGTLFAVYNLLEDQFGVRWICPGDSGIVYQPQTVFTLKEEQSAWKPALRQREIRSGYGYSQNYYKNAMANMPQGFQVSEQKFNGQAEDARIWLKRMRMGRSINLTYGHAFTDWWKKYGKDHPEYFALNEKGVREPLHSNQPDRIKMCVSNPDLPKAVAQEWNKKRNTDNGKIFYETINACENDSAGYCTCPNCRKLDVEGQYSSSVLGAPGKKEISMTDRYVYFSNAILAEAKKIDPQVKAVMYGYSDYEQPPVRETVNHDIIVGFVPSMLNSVADADAFYKKWQAKGVQQMFLRPNDQHCNTGLPMGFEKQMFDHFQVGLKNGIIGTDYDSLHNYWPVSGIADYILAKAHVAPEKPFEYWENDYCSAFGPAKDDIKEYFAYWRNNIWEKRLQPNYKYILGKGRYGNFRRGIMWEMKKYYNEADFDKTDAILAKAAAQKLSLQEQKRVEELILANQHARLLFEALAASKQDKPAAAEKLLEFRLKHKDQLNISWATMFNREKIFEDITGVYAADKRKSGN
ncbi:MAG: DUF4838 domain-containing protein, partial [Victivallaceae bacterium]